MRGSFRPSITGCSPLRQRLLHHERTGLEIDVRIEPGRVEGGDDLAMLHLQQDLGQPGDAGRRLAVSDVRLGRADAAEAAVVGVGAEGLAQRRDLDRIAELRPGAVRLDVAHVSGIGFRLRQCAGDRAGLRLRMGHGVAVRLAAMIERAAADHTVDVIAVPLRVGQPLEDHHADAFAGDVAVASLAEALAVAIAEMNWPPLRTRYLFG